MTPSPAPPSRLLVILAFAAIYVVWGSTYLAIKWVLESAPPFLAAGARFVVAGAVLMAFSLLRGAPWPTRREWGGAAIVGVLLLLGGNGGVMWAETRVPSGLASVIIAMIPVFMVALEGVLGSGARASNRTRGGVAVGLLGVGLLVAPSLLSSKGRELDPGGALALLSSAGLWTVGSLLARKVALPKAPASASGAEMLVGGAALLVAGLATGEAPQVHLEAVTTRTWLAWGYLVLFGSIVAFSAYTWLLSVVAPTRVGTYAFVNPVVALLLGVLVAHETLSGQTIGACLVIVVGVILVVTGREAPATAASSGADGCSGSRDASHRDTNLAPILDRAVGVSGVPATDRG